MLSVKIFTENKKSLQDRTFRLICQIRLWMVFRYLKISASTWRDEDFGTLKVAMNF
jgi:hypothetical protein